MVAVRIHNHQLFAPIACATEYGQSDTASYESQVDARVYRLYDLTDEEIAIVGGGK